MKSKSRLTEQQQEVCIRQSDADPLNDNMRYDMTFYSRNFYCIMNVTKAIQNLQLAGSEAEYTW